MIIDLLSPPKKSWPAPLITRVSPIVAISRIASFWFTSFLSTVRSIVTASSPITPIVATSATQAGSPSACSPTRVSAANTTMIPCAKLNTPDAL